MMNDDGGQIIDDIVARGRMNAIKILASPDKRVQIEQLCGEVDGCVDLETLCNRPMETLENNTEDWRQLHQLHCLGLAGPFLATRTLHIAIYDLGLDELIQALFQRTTLIDINIDIDINIHIFVFPFPSNPIISNG